MVLKIGDTVPSACTRVDHLPLRPLKKDTDNDNTIQFLTPTPSDFLHTAPLASLESSDPLAGMQKVFNDSGLKVCNTIEGGHPTPWGRQYTPFHLWVGGCRPVNVDIDWVSHRLDFGDFDGNFPNKLPDEQERAGWFDPLYPFTFRNDRTANPPPGGNPDLNAWVEGKWFDELSTKGDPDGLDEGIHFGDFSDTHGSVLNVGGHNHPMLNADNDFVTFQARIRRNNHTKDDPLVFTQNPDPQEWVIQRTITCEEANDVLGMDETATEFSIWTVLGTNAGIILDNDGADPALAPDGFAYIINVVYQYSIA